MPDSFGKYLNNPSIAASQLKLGTPKKKPIKDGRILVGSHWKVAINQDHVFLKEFKDITNLRYIFINLRSITPTKKHTSHSCLTVSISPTLRLSP